MSSSRDQISLTGVPGICLAIEHRLAHVVVTAPRRPKPPPRCELVDLALVDRQARRFRRRRQRGLAVLRRRPDLAACSARPARRGVHRLHGGVVLVRVAVDRLDRLRARRRAPPWRRRPGCRRRLRSASSPSFSIAAMSALETLAFGPSSHSIGRASSAVFARHQVSATTATAVSPTCTTFFTPGMLLDLRGVEALDLAAEHRAVLDRGVQHARQLEVDAVDLLAGELVGGVEPLQRLAGDASSPSDPSA